MSRSKRGAAVEHMFEGSVEIIREEGRLHSLANAQNQLYRYALKVSGPYVCGVLLAVITGISLAKTTMGCLYLHQCPAEDNIPIYLIVAGVVSVIHLIGRFVKPVKMQGYFMLLFLFIVVWFITGSVWIFEIYEPNYDETSTDYCNRQLYLFAFWVTIAEYVLGVIVVVYLCVICQLSRPIDDDDDDDDDD